MYKPEFVITNKILSGVGSIEAAKEVIDNANLVADWESKFRVDALTRRVHFGTRIEGNGLTLAQVEKIIRDEPSRDESAEEVAKRVGIVAKERDVKEVMNFRNALIFVDQLSRLGKRIGGYPFGEKELFQIHSLMMERLLPSHQLGVYRGLSVTGHPLPVEISYQMEDFWVWLKGVRSDEMHGVLKVAILWYELFRIFPFSVGNSQVTSTFAALILASEGYGFRSFVSLEEYFERNLTQYRDALSMVESRGGEMTGWLEFFVDALATESIKIKDKVRRMSSDVSVKNNYRGSVALTERQLALMEVFELKEQLSMTEAREVLPLVSDDTILRDLSSLVDKKLIKKKGKTKGVRYLLRK